MSDEKEPAAVIDLTASDSDSCAARAIDLTASDSGSCDENPLPSPNAPRVIKEEAAEGLQRGIWSYESREEKAKIKKRKYDPFPRALSRKRKDQKRRAAVRDSKRVYHAYTMQEKLLQQYLELPGVRDALRAVREFGGGPAAVVEPELVECDVPWPANVTFSLTLDVEVGVALKDSWEADMCLCQRNCFRGDCLNALTNTFCMEDNCNLGGVCSNSIHQTSDAELYNSGLGIGVRATDTIRAGTIVAPYTGVLTNYDYAADPKQYEYVIFKLGAVKARNFTLTRKIQGRLPGLLTTRATPAPNFWRCDTIVTCISSQWPNARLTKVKRLLSIMVQTFGSCVPVEQITAGHWCS